MQLLHSKITKPQTELFIMISNCTLYEIDLHIFNETRCLLAGFNLFDGYSDLSARIVLRHWLCGNALS